MTIKYIGDKLKNASASDRQSPYHLRFETDDGFAVMMGLTRLGNEDPEVTHLWVKCSAKLLPDRRRRLQRLLANIGGYLGPYDGQLVAPPADETLRMRQQSASGECFSSDRYETDGCQPDFENAISTFAVWDKRAEMVCVRDVPGVTLAAVLQHYKDDRPFRQLYGAWCEGRLLIRSKPTRGTTAGRRQTWKANWSGRQWCQGESNNWSGRQWRQGKYHNWSCRQWRQEKSNNGWGSQWREWSPAGGQWRQDKSNHGGGRQWRCKEELDNEWLKAPPPKRQRPNPAAK